MADQPYQTPGASLGGGSRDLSDGHYEFSDIENATIGKTASRANLWGIIAIVIGLLMLLGLGGALFAVTAFSSDIASFVDPAVAGAALVAIMAPLVLVNLLVGWLYIAAGKALQTVVDSEGNDVELMMNGLDKMAAAFKLEAIVTVVGVALAVVANVVATTAQGQGGF